MTSLSRTLLLAFSALGLGASTASTYVHYRLLTDIGYASFCDVSATVSCTQAYLSQYGSLWGVPVAIGGIVYFAIVLLLAGLAGRTGSRVRESVPGYVFALSTVALAVVLYLAWAAFFVLNAVCILCIVTYVAVIANFIVSGGATSFPMTSLPGRAARDARALFSSPLALVATLVLAVAIAAVVVYFPREALHAQQQTADAPLPTLTAQQRAEFEAWWNVQPRTVVPVPNEGAPVVVVKFNDFQCPPCRQTYELYRRLLAERVAAGEVRYVMKHFPLEGECNPAASRGTHYAACEAAAAHVLAGEKTTADRLEEWFFANQPALTADLVKKGAREVGGIENFDARYPEALEAVKADAAMGASLGVNSTPTFFINGRRTPALPPEYFNLAIELELPRTR